MAALPVPFAGAGTICLTVAAAERRAMFAVGVGDTLALAFTHSIYGSQVEEHFRIGARAFQPVQLRYAEQRLVEFYGYESARRQGGWWVVDASGAELTYLDLRASQDASMRVAFHDHQIVLGGTSSSGGHARLSVSACPGK
jgi:hypothetical protein